MAISKKFFVDIDLQGNGLNNSTVGANANMTKAGSFQYNAAETRLEYFNGSLVEQVANLSDISAVTGGLILQGAYDAATNTPNITDGNALKGYFWVVTVAGTFLGETVQVGDSIIAKVDEAGALLTDWLILQGNVVIATTEVAGITYLATQEQVNGGTETGAYAVTPATLQGKIDAQITPEINNKLPLAGGTMSGGINMGSNEITNVGGISLSGGMLNMGGRNLENANSVQAGIVSTSLLNSPDGTIVIGNTINADSNAIINLPAPTNGGDAANKTYVDGAASTAESNANTYTDGKFYTNTYANTVWTLADGVYSLTVTHNLGSSTPKVSAYDGGNLIEFGVAIVSGNVVTLTSNIAPPASVSVGVAY